MSLEANKQLVATFFAHFGRKDVQGALDMMTADATWWIGGKPDLFPICGLKTKAQMAEILNGLVLPSKNGLAITPKGMIAEGNKVACEAESMAILGNGRTYNNEYHFVIEIRDGKVAAVKEYLDTMHTADVLKG
ncbi:MAG TPA: nuclear transport factor 2 family protein [Nevskiaceae bacterium]|nr:nuclear transport factor 2 family protein [Nevskiaceae bacterium]